MEPRDWELSSAKFAWKCYKAFFDTQRFFWFVEQFGGVVMGSVTGYLIGRGTSGWWSPITAIVGAIAGVFASLLVEFLYYLLAGC